MNKSRNVIFSYIGSANMRLLGHLGSDLDETWWKLFPGVSRSFLNSSGTKITCKNISKNEIQNFKNIVKISYKSLTLGSN